MFMTKLIFLLGLAVWTSSSWADQLVDAAATNVTGRNVYSPSVIFDNGRFEMWYGGWQSASDLPNDRIYFRASVDGLNWSAPTQVLSPSQLPGASFTHVNDPSVTKHRNAANGMLQYTMFYTACAAPCAQGDNQIWSAVSSDGLNWSHHQVLLSSTSLGPAGPSAVIDPQPDGTFWRLYYVDRFDPWRVKVANVNGDRRATSASVAFENASELMGDVEVVRFGTEWHLFFGAFVFHGNTLDRVDVKKVVSASPMRWTGVARTLISNSGSAVCATITPGVLQTGARSYSLFFGVHLRGASGCSLTEFTGIHRWRWNLP